MYSVKQITRSFAALLVTALIATSTGATAAPAAVNVDKTGVAILGYDPVAYFEMSKPVKGNSEHTYDHKGAIYHFVSNRHRRLFAADPGKYIPAYGGWCSYGMRYGQTSRIDPRSWDIVGGRLYLSLNQGTRAVWLKAKLQNITIANRLWQKVFVKAER